MKNLITDIDHLHAELYCAFGLNHPDDFIQPEGARIAKIAQILNDFWIMMESCDPSDKAKLEKVKRKMWAIEEACKNDWPENKRVYEVVSVIMSMGEEIETLKDEITERIKEE